MEESRRPEKRGARTRVLGKTATKGTKAADQKCIEAQKARGPPCVPCLGVSEERGPQPVHLGPHRAVLAPAPKVRISPSPAGGGKAGHKASGASLPPPGLGLGPCTANRTPANFLRGRLHAHRARCGAASGGSGRGSTGGLCMDSASSNSGSCDLRGPARLLQQVDGCASDDDDVNAPAPVYGLPGRTA